MVTSNRVWSLLVFHSARSLVWELWLVGDPAGAGGVVQEKEDSPGARRAVQVFHSSTSFPVWELWLVGDPAGGGGVVQEKEDCPGGHHRHRVAS